MAKLSTSHGFTKGVSGCYVLINKWHSWVKSAIHGIQLYVQSAFDETFEYDLAFRPLTNWSLSISDSQVYEQKDISQCNYDYNEAT